MPFRDDSLASRLRRLGQGALLVLTVIGLSATGAAAVPSFAVQTGQPCNACHVGGFGPQLTPFGREFKLGGYTARTNKFNVPLSVMAVASYLHTQKDQPSAPALGYGVNDNAALDQASLFFAGGFGEHLGAFVQTTYDGVAKAFHWDNLDVRATTNATVAGTKMILGVSLNNAPTVQDAFNTLPSWGYPYTASALAPQPGAAPLVGNLAQSTLGLTAYAWINSSIYVEGGGYRSPTSRLLNDFGVDPTDPGGIRGTAPYGRIAYQKNFGDRNFEVGVFGMSASLNPGRDSSTGLGDHYADLGVDGSFQLFRSNKDVFTLNGRYTHERQRLDASQTLGAASNGRDGLEDLRVDGSYYWRDKIGLTLGVFDTWGSQDALLYAANRTLRPNSSGATVQVDGTPFGAGGSPLGPRFNMRVGAQYTAYRQFNGAGLNYDSLGDSASSANTLRLFLWVAY